MPHLIYDKQAEADARRLARSQQKALDQAAALRRANTHGRQSNTLGGMRLTRWRETVAAGEVRHAEVLERHRREADDRARGRCSGFAIGRA